MAESIWQYTLNVLKQEVKAQYASDKEAEITAEVNAIIDRVFSKRFSQSVSGRPLNDEDIGAIGGLMEGIVAIIQEPQVSSINHIYPMVISFSYEFPPIGERHASGRMEIVFGYESK